MASNGAVDSLQLKLCLLVGVHGVLLELWLPFMACCWSYGWCAAGAMDGGLLELAGCWLVFAAAASRMWQ